MKLGELVDAILTMRRSPAGARASLVAISGIDAAGKGFVTARFAEALRNHGLNVAVLSVDDWLNLPAVRFGSDDPAAHFYEKAIRFEEMFARLVEPLASNRSIHLEADAATETATRYYKKRFVFREIDVVLIEGIFLLKRAYRPRFDLAVWIECSFATALQRAIQRRQEGLSSAETVRVFEQIYFPAQRIHFVRDHPAASADATVANDLRAVSL